jgi:hypothetical protein
MKVRRWATHGPPLRRQDLVNLTRERLLRESAPRVQLAVIIGLAGLAAFICSAVTLRIGFLWMAVRYPLAVMCGYAIFFGLIRWWIVWQRRADDAQSRSSVADVAAEVLDVRVPGRGSADVPLFGAGRSGGGGASAQFIGPSGAPVPKAGGRGVAIDLDLDEAWWLVLVIACVAGGAIAIGYVVYAAPLLLAEVALDAAVVSVLYRRLKKDDVSHWAMTVLRRTWIPALALVVFAAIGGYAMQQVAPEAQSIGGFARALRGN